MFVDLPNLMHADVDGGEDRVKIRKALEIVKGSFSCQARKQLSGIKICRSKSSILRVFCS